MLYLWMPEANGVWQWSHGDGWEQSSSLEKLIQDIQPHHGEEATVFFPSRNVQILAQSMNKAAYKKMGQEGIAYLLEEYLIVPLDAMKVLHTYQADVLTICAMSNHSLETIQHVLQLIPVKMVSLLPDFLVLPQPEQGSSCLVQVDDRLLVRESEFSGHLIDDLEIYLSYQANTQNYQLSYLSEAQLNILRNQLGAERLQSFQYRFQDLKKPKQHAFNMLPKLKSNTRISYYWRASAVLFMFALMLQFSYDAIRWYQNKQIANIAAEQAISQYKEWFGVNSRVTEQNLKSQFESHVRMNQSSDQQALQLLSRVGPTLMQQQIVAQRVVYAASALDLELLANTTEQLQNLTKQLTQQGFQVELGNIQQGERGVIGLVKIK